MILRQEKTCIECGASFPKKSMIYSTKTNPYGDKMIKGYICSFCYKKRTEKRSMILLTFALVFIGLSIILGIILIWVYFFIKGLTEDQFLRITESFSLMGALIFTSGLSLLLIRRRELNKLKNQIKRE